MRDAAIVPRAVDSQRMSQQGGAKARVGVRREAILEGLVQIEARALRRLQEGQPAWEYRPGDLEGFVPPGKSDSSLRSWVVRGFVLLV